ncbi:hypothetical protein N7468_001564 [Penicillium chermesinum]|uniref:Lysozyme n=1 Tax=Penicillium chermesinum TaxID=63820 RepID=A0A9W9PIK2_9EURO|nr:uncharacterized protein N7468_001564 [Penicillium chermesinum]KAJ5246581.1 hypothetical protein N7468_001564 [Penicillium chermesinum]KAJ6144851.1 hypothetical protein N7470_008746 [Penicillium chermesinum]
MSTEIRRMSPSARAKLKERESLQTTPYRDAGGSMAIGYGINQKWHPEEYDAIVANPTIEQCNKSFDRVLAKFERDVQKRAPNYHECNQNMADAILMRAYNAGADGALKDLKGPMQARDWNEVARRMGSTCTKHKDGGSLAKIRKEDQELFSSSMNLGPEGHEPHHDTTDVNEADQSDGDKFEPHGMPFARIDLGRGCHFGAGLDDSGNARVQIGFNCITM